MKFTKRLSPTLNKLGGLLASTLIRNWMNTLEYQVAYYDRAIDPVYPECRGQKIYIFWHEYILFPLMLRGHTNMAMLLSQHRDADILSRVAYHLGFEFVRGSTNRGGVTALRELLRKSRDLHLTITPDGPRGPRRKLAPGPIYLASKLGLPLVLMGFGYDRAWRMNSWDRFAVPHPFARGRAIPSGEIYIPPHLDRDGVEHHRQRIETLLNRVTTEAEEWAVSGSRRVGQQPVLRAPAWARRFPDAQRESLPAALQTIFRCRVPPTADAADDAIRAVS